MAWNTKYYTQFRNDANQLFVLYIKEDGFAGSAVELNSGASPVDISQASSNYLESIVGAGMNINLISATSLQLLDLNIVSKFGNKVELFRDSYLIWQGWLNAEEYKETYSEYENYDVNLSANDGLALLNDVKFVQSDGSKYSGVASAFTVITTALAKTQLDLVNLTIADNFTVHNSSNAAIDDGTNNTYLHTIKVNYDNYIDETGEPMSCREVLDGILTSLGLMLRNNVLSKSSASTIPVGYTIYDTNCIVPDGSITFKSYTLAGVYVSSTTVLTTDYIYDLQNDLQYTNTGSSMYFDKAVNNQQISFSKYIVADLIDATIDEDIAGVPDSKNERSSVGCSSATRWSEWVYPIARFPKFNFIQTGTYPAEEVQGVSGVVTEVRTGDYYIAISEFASGAQEDMLFETAVDTPVIFKGYDYTVSDYPLLGLFIEFSSMISRDTCKPSDPVRINSFYFTIRIAIGNQYFYVPAYFGKFNSTVFTDEWMQPQFAVATLNDTRTGILVYFSTTIGNVITPGKVRVGITKNHSVPLSIITANTRFRFKDFKVKLVNADSVNRTYSEFTSGTDSIISGTVNPLASTFGEEISLIHGTGTVGGMERGQLMYENPSVANSYFNITKISKSITVGSLLIMTVEKWLLSKVFSNQYNPAVMLENIAVKASTLVHSNLARITDVAQFPTKKFMVLGYTYKPYDNEIIYSLREINKDTYTPV